MISNFPKATALELVPRSLETLLLEAETSLAEHPWITSINIPEIMSVPIKSFEATSFLLEHKVPVTAHFRMIDRSIYDFSKMVEALVERGLERVLIIGGDVNTSDPDFRSSGVTSLAAIREIRRLFPALKIYAGIDPYRSSFRSELDYAFQKREAGCDGFFTQPFFSVGMLELWLEQLPTSELWVGIAPVYTEKSKIYWERRNNVVFPPSFDFSHAWNAKIARHLIAAIAEAGQNAYLMPVRVSIADYLREIQ